jgi:chromosome segregation ATPase
MKLAIGLLVVAVIVLAALLVNLKQTANRESAAAREQLTAVSNEVTAARTETGGVKAQMGEQAAASELKISALTAEKAQAEEQIQQLTNQLSVVQLKLQEEQQKVGELEQETQRQSAQIGTITNQLVTAQQELTALGESHKVALGHLAAMREEYVVQAQEKAALDAKLHNLGALKEQIHVVKVEMHNQKVTEWKRSDRAGLALGNGGFLLKEGKWVATPAAPSSPGKFPLTQEIRAPND